VLLAVARLLPRGDIVTDWNVNLERAIYGVAQFIPAHAFLPYKRLDMPIGKRLRVFLVVMRMRASRDQASTRARRHSVAVPDQPAYADLERRAEPIAISWFIDWSIALRTIAS
jgi:hypothetical protein